MLAQAEAGLKFRGLGEETILTKVQLMSIFAPIDQQGQTIQLIIHEAKHGEF